MDSQVDCGLGWHHDLSPQSIGPASMSSDRTMLPDHQLS